MKKNIEDGLRAGLGMDLTGKVFINASILNETKGVSKIIRFLVDTGFDGYLQLNKIDVEELGLDMVEKSKSIIANGTKIETGITKTKIKILDEEITNFPIQFVEGGVALIGTRLLRDTKRMLIFDYEDGYTTLTLVSDIKNRIKQLIDKSYE